jgi:pyruvate/2-oxoglutarate dehydrogenase complex dihydrolipoamide dehydrogenase (E3) component
MFCSSNRRRPRVEDIRLEAVGIEPNPKGIVVDARVQAGDGVWAIRDVTGIWPLTYVGRYQGPDRRREHPRDS